jgi:hypothetical protein
MVPLALTEDWPERSGEPRTLLDPASVQPWCVPRVSRLGCPLGRLMTNTEKSPLSGVKQTLL